MKNFILFCLTTLLMIVIESCQKDSTTSTDTSLTALQYPGDLAESWLKLECKIVKDTKGFFPPQAARAFGYTGVALYESTVNGIPGAKSLGGQLNGLDAATLPKPANGVVYNWAVVANTTLADMMRKMFSGNISAADAAAIDSLETLNLASAQKSGSGDVTQSQAFGKAVSLAVYNYSITDGGDKSYIDPFQLPYTLPIGDDKWIPTNPAVPSPISPRWGTNRTFLTINTTTAASPPTPIAFAKDSATSFWKAHIDVYNQVKNNGTEQIEIAKFWADDPFNTCTPTGHSFNIMTQLLEENRASLAQAAVAYAKMGITENDIFICCWAAKYNYNLIRPFSYIRRYIDPNFKTVIGTPAFPAFTSGHASEIGAVSRILTKTFTNGDGAYPFTDRTQLQFGFSVRNFNNFEELAQECAASRFYAGIHCKQDNDNGLKMGKSVGDNVNVFINWPTVK